MSPTRDDACRHDASRDGASRDGGPSSRRAFLTDFGMGFTGLALGALLARDGLLGAEGAAPAAAQPPKARSVIWLFMVGGTSQMESFDPKPALDEHAGKEIAETPFRNALDNPFVKDNVRIVVPNDANGHIRSKLYPMQTSCRRHGANGVLLSDWWPQLARRVDDIAIVRSLWTTDNNHGAQLQFHTGRHSLDGFFPTIGSWVHYGLGTINESLPQFVVLGEPIADCCGGNGAHSASYLGPEHAGVRLAVDPRAPIPFLSPGRDVYVEEQNAQFGLVDRLDKLAQARYPEDAALRARIKSYELAYRMQRAVPEVMQFEREPDSTRALYGLDDDVTRGFGARCLAARRLVERGVRFVQVFHGSNGGAGAWDAHSGLKKNHERLCAEVDRPIAGLLEDLKRRGLLDETIVVWGTEFGRTPGSQNGDGRDHHPYGFSVWLAGGGIRGGVVHGATDEIGFHAVEHRHYITDVHATVLQQLGLDARRMEIPGRKRLEIELGNPIDGIIA